jgi:hypothetical protein
VPLRSEKFIVGENPVSTIGVLANLNVNFVSVAPRLVFWERALAEKKCGGENVYKMVAVCFSAENRVEVAEQYFFHSAIGIHKAMSAFPLRFDFEPLLEPFHVVLNQ